jgi:hypothetical protein
MLTYSLSDLLLLAVGSLVVFVLREYIYPNINENRKHECRLNFIVEFGMG